jgi:NitT/TauT family transport system permease protein
VTVSERTITGAGGLSGTPLRQRHKETRLQRIVRSQRLRYGATGVIGFLLLWEIAARSGSINTQFFGSPTMIASAGVTLLQDPDFWGHAGISLYEFAVGFGLAVIIGIPLGLAAGWFERLNYALDPWMSFFNALPRVALIPVIILFFGVLGPGAKIVTVFLGAFISILIVTVMGVRTVDRRFLDVARSFRVSQRRMFTSVVAPATVPFMITGLRLGVARALIGVVTAEIFLQTGGLGFLIRRFAESRQGDRMLFTILIFTIAGIVSVQLIRNLEGRFQRWRPEREA